MNRFLLPALLAACTPEEGAPQLREGPEEHDPGQPGAGDTAATDTARPVDTAGVSEPVGQVCYPGADDDDTACVDLVAYSTSFGSDYDYPEPYEGSPQYTQPARFVDLYQADATLPIAPNFVLNEVMSAHKGRWGVFQVHTVESIQAIRDAIGGPLTVNSGYRSPAYNASVGGVTWSRHMYGDAVDIVSSVASLDDLGSLCDALGAGYVGYYTAHVHCDWRDDPLDPAFYDVSRIAALAPRPLNTAHLVRVGSAWSAPATGFDEGEPLRRWTAYDAAGHVIDEARGPRYTPPLHAARFTVDVGGQVLLERDLR